MRQRVAVPSRRGLSLLMAVLLGLGCSNTIAARRPQSEATLAEVNEAVKGRPGTLMLKGGDPAHPIEVENVKIGRDTTQWLARAVGAEEARPTSVPTAALLQVTVVRRGRGAVEGLAIGLPVGLILGGVVGYSLGDDTKDFPGKQIFGVVGGLVGALTGAVAGAIVGAAVGHRTTIEF